MIIGRDRKTVVVKHGGLLRNVLKIYITQIQDYCVEEYEKEEAERERNLIRSEEDSEGEDSESGEEVIYGGNGEEEVRGGNAMYTRNTNRRVRKGDRYKIKRMGGLIEVSGNLE